MGKRKKKRKQTSVSREAVNTIKEKTSQEMSFKEKAKNVTKTVGNSIKACALKVADFFKNVVWKKGLKVAYKAVVSFFKDLFKKIKNKKPMLGMPSAEYKAVLKRFPGVTSIRELSILAKNSAAGADDAYLEVQKLSAEVDEINSKIASLRTPKDADEATSEKLSGERAALRDERDARSKKLFIAESKGRSLEVAADEYAYLYKLFTGKEVDFRDTERFAEKKIDITKEEALLLIRALEFGERREAKKNLKSAINSDIKEEKMKKENFFKDIIWEKGIKAAGLAVAAFATKKVWPSIKKAALAVRDFFKNVVWEKGLKKAALAVRDFFKNVVWEKGLKKPALAVADFAKQKVFPSIKKAAVAVKNFCINIIWKKGLKQAITVVSGFCTNVIWAKGLKVAYIAVVAFSTKKVWPFLKENYKKWWFITACALIVVAVVCAVAIPASNKKNAEASAYDVKVVEPPKSDKAIVEETQAAAEKAVATAQEEAAAVKAAADETVAKAQAEAAAIKAAADESVAKAKEAAAATKSAAESSVSKATTAAEKAIANAKEEAAAVKAAAEKAVAEAEEEAAAVKVAAEKAIAEAKKDAAAVKAAAEKDAAAVKAAAEKEAAAVKAAAEKSVAKAEKEVASVKAAAEKSVADAKAAADKAVAKAEKDAAAVKAAAEKSVADAKAEVASAKAKAESAVAKAEKSVADALADAEAIKTAAGLSQKEAEAKAAKLAAENEELSEKNELLNSKLYAAQKAEEDEKAQYTGKLNSVSFEAVPYVAYFNHEKAEKYTNMFTLNYTRLFNEKFTAGTRVSFVGVADDTDYNTDAIEALVSAGYVFNLKNNFKFNVDLAFGVSFNIKSDPRPVLALGGQFVLPEGKKSNFSVGIGAGFEYQFDNRWRIIPFELSINYKF